jgi:hypothetical protein
MRMDSSQISHQEILPASVAIRGAEGLTPSDLLSRLESGSRCVQFELCVSVVLASFRVQSPIYLTDGRQDRYLLAICFSLLSLALGPWGVPWGPTLTARAVWANLSGSGDITAQVAAHLAGQPPQPPSDGAPAFPMC